MFENFDEDFQTNEESRAVTLLQRYRNRPQRIFPYIKRSSLYDAHSKQHSFFALPKTHLHMSAFHHNKQKNRRWKIAGCPAFFRRIFSPAFTLPPQVLAHTHVTLCRSFNSLCLPISTNLSLGPPIEPGIGWKSHILILHHCIHIDLLALARLDRLLWSPDVASLEL